MTTRRRVDPAIAIALARHGIEPRHHASASGIRAVAARPRVHARACADVLGHAARVRDARAGGAIDLAAADLTGACRLRQRIGARRAAAFEAHAGARRLRRLFARRVPTRLDAPRRHARVVPAAVRIGRARDDGAMIATEQRRWRRGRLGRRRRRLRFLRRCIGARGRGERVRARWSGRRRARARDEEHRPELDPHHGSVPNPAPRTWGHSTPSATGSQGENHRFRTG